MPLIWLAIPANRQPRCLVFARDSKAALILITVYITVSRSADLKVLREKACAKF